MFIGQMIISQIQKYNICESEIQSSSFISWDIYTIYSLN